MKLCVYMLQFFVLSFLTIRCESDYSTDDGSSCSSDESDSFSDDGGYPGYGRVERRALPGGGVVNVNCNPPVCYPCPPLVNERPRQEVCDVRVKNVRQKVCRSGVRRRFNIDFDQLRRIFEHHFIHSEGFIRQKFVELSNELGALADLNDANKVRAVKERLEHLEWVILEILRKTFESLVKDGDLLIETGLGEILRGLLQLTAIIKGEAVTYAQGIIGLNDPTLIFNAVNNVTTGLIPTFTNLFASLEAGTPSIVIEGIKKLIVRFNELLHREKEIIEHAIKKAFKGTEREIIEDLTRILGLEKAEIRKLVESKRLCILHEIHRVLHEILREIDEIIKHLRFKRGGKRCRTKRFQLKEVNCRPE